MFLCSIPQNIRNLHPCFNFIITQENKKINVLICKCLYDFVQIESAVLQSVQEYGMIIGEYCRGDCLWKFTVLDIIIHMVLIF